MSDSEEWEEESTVIMKLNGIIEDDWIQHVDGECKIIGLESKEPIFQLGRYIFRGEHTQAKGTNLLFGQKGNSYKFEEQTFTELKLDRIFLKPKGLEDDAPTATSDPNNASADSQFNDLIASKRAMTNSKLSHALSAAAASGLHIADHLVDELSCSDVYKVIDSDVYKGGALSSLSFNTRDDDDGDDVSREMNFTSASVNSSATEIYREANVPEPAANVSGVLEQSDANVSSVLEQSGANVSSVLEQSDANASSDLEQSGIDVSTVPMSDGMDTTN